MAKRNVTKHFKERYVERVLGIKDAIERKTYISQNDQEIYDGSNAMLEGATMVWQGKISDYQNCTYYIKDNWVIVCDEQDTAMVTTFKCDLSLPDEVNKVAIKGLIKEVDKLRKQAEKQEQKESSTIGKKQAELENVDANIQAMEAQLKLWNERKSAIQKDIQTSNTESRALKEQLKRNVHTLVNSIEYRNDILGLKHAR